MSTGSDDYPTVQERLKADYAEWWKGGMTVELHALQEMSCWTAEKRPPQTEVLNSTSVLKKNRKARAHIEK